jgi:NAD(P)H dehydrogenase (quinone)
VTAREFDYGEPEPLAEALFGRETLLLISSSEVGQRVAQHRKVIEAAKIAGVIREGTVLVSLELEIERVVDTER